MVNYGPIPASPATLIREETEQVIDYLDRMLSLGDYSRNYAPKHAMKEDSK